MKNSPENQQLEEKHTNQIPYIAMAVALSFGLFIYASLILLGTGWGELTIFPYGSFLAFWFHDSNMALDKLFILFVFFVLIGTMIGNIISFFREDAYSTKNQNRIILIIIFILLAVWAPLRFPDFQKEIRNVRLVHAKHKEKELWRKRGF